MNEVEELREEVKRLRDRIERYEKNLRELIADAPDGRAKTFIQNLLKNNQVES